MKIAIMTIWTTKPIQADRRKYNRSLHRPFTHCARCVIPFASLWRNQIEKSIRIVPSIEININTAPIVTYKAAFG